LAKLKNAQATFDEDKCGLSSHVLMALKMFPLNFYVCLAQVNTKIWTLTFKVKISLLHSKLLIRFKIFNSILYTYFRSKVRVATNQRSNYGCPQVSLRNKFTAKLFAEAKGDQRRESGICVRVYSIKRWDQYKRPSMMRLGVLLSFFIVRPD
jgi:hypothetical protein